MAEPPSPAVRREEVSHPEFRVSQSGTRRRSTGIAGIGVLLAASVFFLTPSLAGQDASTGAIRGTVSDVTGARIPAAAVTVTNTATGIVHTATASVEGIFAFQLLPPGEYEIRAAAPAMAPQARIGHLDIGGEVELQFRLPLASVQETVTVSAEATPLLETQSSTISSVLDERAITELPLNGRRFSDLALLAPGVTQDPRGLTSATNGDLAFGGVRGFHPNFLVDGADNNNAFFAQARGRYRAPYQFSNEVVQEFRVSSNTYGVELGRSGGAVVNVATKSGSNFTHGSAFYYLRDSSFNARSPFTDVKPSDQQQQFGFTVGGPIVKNKLFYFGGFDQHIFHVPTVVRLVNGTSTIVPRPRPPMGGLPGEYDYDPCPPVGGPACDQALVTAAASQLNNSAGTYRTALVGNASFFKLDYAISPRHYLTARVNVSRFSGQNNVFFDPASPVTYFAITDNGTEDVRTESVVVSLTSALSMNTSSHLRVQFSRDLQASWPNSTDPLVKIYGITDGFGRSSILPRNTREHRIHIAETLTLQGRRHTWKFGGDALLTFIRNFFPSLYGGEYIFDDIKVNPWTFQPQAVGGLKLTPLRAYAHEVPRYYLQRFGTAVSHPDTKEYALFLQDALRVTSHFALTLGVRYDLQTFRTDGLKSNPLWPDSGKLPLQTNNFAPRAGFAYSMGNDRPLVFRGGYGWFYPRIPQIYTSAVETNNGLTQGFLFLDNSKFADQQVFPTYPAPLAACPPASPTCTAPPGVAGKLTSDISAFARNFQTPLVQQASLSVEREIGERIAVGASYLYVHGQHLIRARDVNLPPPALVQYPVFDGGNNFTGDYYGVYSFATWETKKTTDCAFPPCLNDVQRPIPQVGAINVFESAASSVYHGLTISVRRRMTNGVYFRLAYTWAHALDDGQDALVTTSSDVQNSYSTRGERGPSVTDQRHRFVVAWMAEPEPFHREHARLGAMFNHWKFSGVVTAGSGRPVNARVFGDANADGNTSNDRLPGAGRNSYLGPDYATVDLRIARKLHVGDRIRVEALAESFNLLNRDNRRVQISDDGFLNSAANFVQYSQKVGTKSYPAYYQRTATFMQATNAYAPRQVQFALKLLF